MLFPNKVENALTQYKKQLCYRRCPKGMPDQMNRFYGDFLKSEEFGNLYWIRIISLGIFLNKLAINLQL